jgi:DNA-directed RNA polymerase specialized sigma24 family protein
VTSAVFCSALALPSFWGGSSIVSAWILTLDRTLRIGLNPLQVCELPSSLMIDSSSDIALPDLAGGNAAAWRDAYPALYRELWIVLTARLRSGFGVDVEDLIVEIITEEIMPGLSARTTESFAKLRTFGELLALGRTIAARRAVDVIRRVMRRKEEALPEDWDHLLGTTDPDLEADHEDFWRWARLLKPPKPELFSDYFIGGLNYREIAEARGLAVGVVCCHFKRGLDELRRLMRPETKMESKGGRP